MRKNIRRTRSKYWLYVLAFIIMLFICFFISLVILKNIKNKYDIDLENVQDQIQSKKIYAYEAKENISSGQIIRREDLNYMEIYSSQDKKFYFDEKNFGMVSKIDITKGTYLLEDMFVEDTKVSNLREIEYNILFLNGNLNESDYVDVRIIFPNGEDLIILSKKNIKHLNKETGKCYLWLSEKEILSMAGALVDTYVFPGSKIYTTRYLEPHLQEASDVNYKPNLSTLALMQRNTNILEDMEELDEILLDPKVYQDNQGFRKELEFRLKEFYSETDYNFKDPIEGVGGYREDVNQFEE